MLHCRRFKALADKKKLVSDEDIIALVSDELHQPQLVWELQDLQVRKHLIGKGRIRGELSPSVLHSWCWRACSNGAFGRRNMSGTLLSRKAALRTGQKLDEGPFADEQYSGQKSDESGRAALQMSSTLSVPPSALGLDHSDFCPECACASFMVRAWILKA